MKIYTSTCTQMFIGALFIKPQTGIYPNIQQQEKVNRLCVCVGGGGHPYNGTLLKKQKEKMTGPCHYKDESEKHYAK